MHKNPAGFSGVLRRLMKRHKLTVAKLAASVEVSEAAVLKWRGGQVPTVARLNRLATLFHCKMEDLLENTSQNPERFKEWSRVPLEYVPADVIRDAGLMGAMQNIADLVAEPGGAERFQKIMSAMSAKLALKTKDKMGVDNLRNSVNIIPMSNMETLLARLRAALAARGKKGELAKFLGVEPARVSEWLSGKREPGGETTLKLLHWVAEQERQ